MIRLRFEKAEQVFETDYTVILPMAEIPAYLSGADGMNRPVPWVELPAMIWPGAEKSVAEKLKELRAMGVEHAVAENIGAAQLALDCGFVLHGGFTLNVLNSEAAALYASLGFADLTASFEMAVSDYKGQKPAVPMGLTVYGYLPLMKFRNCPAKGEKGCGACSGRSVLTDRMNKKFTVICRRKQYSELLNCVPLYLGDRELPASDFQLLYLYLQIFRLTSLSDSMQDLSVLHFL